MKTDVVDLEGGLAAEPFRGANGLWGAVLYDRRGLDVHDIPAVHPWRADVVAAAENVAARVASY